MALLDERSDTRMQAPSATSAEVPRETARRTLAMRIAHRNRLRAERLARLRPEAPAAGSAVGSPVGSAPDSDSGVDSEAVSADAVDRDEDGAALEEFLRALTGATAGTPAPPPGLAEPEPAAVLQFQRPSRAAPDAAQTRDPAAPDAAQTREPAAPDPALSPGHLARLPGMGPGLAWACARAGLAGCAEIAALAPEELAARLGPLGRLIPAAAWIAAARAATRADVAEPPAG